MHDDTPRSNLQINGNESEEEEPISKTSQPKKSVKKAKSKPGVSQGTDLLNDRSDDNVFKGGATKNGAKEGDFLSNVESG